MATAAQNVQKTGENTYAVDRDFHLKRCISMLQGALEQGNLHSESDTFCIGCCLI